MENVVSIDHNKKNVIEFELETEGVETKGIEVKFMVETKDMDMGFAAKKKRGKDGIWAVRLPALPMLSKTAYNFCIEVHAEGYYFEPLKGTLNVVGSPEVYTTKVRNATLDPTKDAGKVEDKKEEKEEKPKKKITKEDIQATPTKGREKTIDQIASELMADKDKKAVQEKAPAEKPIETKVAPEKTAEKPAEKKEEVKETEEPTPAPKQAKKSTLKLNIRKDDRVAGLLEKDGIVVEDDIIEEAVVVDSEKDKQVHDILQATRKSAEDKKAKKEQQTIEEAVTEAKTKIEAEKAEQKKVEEKKPVVQTKVETAPIVEDTKPEVAKDQQVLAVLEEIGIQPKSKKKRPRISFIKTELFPED